MTNSEARKKEKKVKYVDLYNALVCSALFYGIGLRHTQGSQAWITQFYLQLHQCLSLPRKRSPDGASQTEVANI